MTESPEDVKKLEEQRERRWKKFQELQGYSDEEMKFFRSNPRFVKAMERSPRFMTHKIVAEVIQSRSCNAGHKVGDKFVMTGNGYLIAEESPKQMCMFALQSIAPLVYPLFERFVENLEGNEALFSVVHCPDPGLACGGWGGIALKIYSVPREEKPRSPGKK